MLNFSQSINLMKFDLYSKMFSKSSIQMVYCSGCINNFIINFKKRKMFNRSPLHLAKGTDIKESVTICFSRR